MRTLARLGDHDSPSSGRLAGLGVVDTDPAGLFVDFTGLRS
jgi:hypothetical protein